MPIKITDLEVATTPLAGTEPLEIVQDGRSKQVQAQDVAGVTPPLTATYVTVTANATLPNERILAVGAAANLTLVDGGAGANITISMTDMAQATVKGRASGAGTGAPQDLTATQLQAILATVGAGYLSVTATARVTGQDNADVNTSDEVVIIGTDAFESANDGADFAGSVVIGTRAMQNVTLAQADGSSVAIGLEAGQDNVNANSGANVFIGTRAAKQSQIQSTNITRQNVVIGFEAGERAGDNTFSGAVLIGYRAGRCSTVNNFVNPSNCVYIGALVGQNQNSGTSNVAIGNGPMSVGTISGGSNVAIGSLTGANLSSGGENILLGANTGNGLSTGSTNILIGDDCATTLNDNENVMLCADGWNAASGSNNVILGYRAASAIDGTSFPDGNDNNFVVEAVQASGVERQNFLYGRMDVGNLVFGLGTGANDEPAAGDRAWGGGTPESVFKILDTGSAPSSAASNGVTMWSASGLLNFFGGMQNRGETFFLGIVEPATLGAGTTNNWAPTLTGATRVRFDGPAAADVTGLAGGADGRFLILTNDGANAIIFRDEDAGSTAANRFAFNGDITVGQNESFSIIYDGSISRWTRTNNA